MTSVLLYSGGMDSYALRGLFPPDICLFIDIGNKYAAAERARLDTAVKIVEFPLLRQYERADLIIPLRNLFFVTIAAQYGDVIYLGATAGDRVRDKSLPFAKLTSDLLSYLWQQDYWTEGRQFRVELPLKHLTKRQIVQHWVSAGFDPVELANHSFSCYSPGPKNQECGECKPCFRKWVAFAGTGVRLPFNSAPYIIREILPQIQAGTYGREAEAREIVEALHA